MYFTYSSLPVFSHNHEQQAAAHASNSLLPHTLTTHMRSPSLFPSAAHWHILSVMIWTSGENTTVPLRCIRCAFLFRRQTAPAAMEKAAPARAREHLRRTFIFIRVSLRLSSPPSGNRGAQIVFSRWRLHNEHTTSPRSTPSLNAWEQHSSQVLFLHAYHCCCHSCGCLSLAFCVLKLLIYSSFLPGTLHLICDERTGAGDKMFQYYRYIKRNFSFSFFFLYNACMKMRCPLASGAFISSFVEEKVKKKLSTVNCDALDDKRNTAVLIKHTLFLHPSSLSLNNHNFQFGLFF